MKKNRVLTIVTTVLIIVVLAGLIGLAVRLIGGKDETKGEVTVTKFTFDTADYVTLLADGEGNLGGWVKKDKLPAEFVAILESPGVMTNPEDITSMENPNYFVSAKILSEDSLLDLTIPCVCVGLEMDDAELVQFGWLFSDDFRVSNFDPDAEEFELVDDAFYFIINGLNGATSVEFEFTVILGDQRVIDMLYNVAISTMLEGGV